jgi:glycosyltransferase involved in cell wall biosynthesis
MVLEVYSLMRIPMIRRRKQATLLVVGMVESSHLQSWIRATLREKFFDQIWIVPSDYPVNGMTFQSLGLSNKLNCKLKTFRFPVGKKLNNLIFRFLDLTLGRKWRSILIFRYIRLAKPNVLHFHELQHGAYLFNPIYKYFDKGRNFRIICSTWGSDLLFYGELKSHSQDIEKVLSWTDIMTAERVDDKRICNKFNYYKEFLAPVYITVGLDTPIEPPKVRSSERRKILIKGYQDNHGRALNALAALDAVKTNLQNFGIRVFSASEAVRLQIEFLKSTKNWDIEMINKTSNKEIRKHFSESRIYIGLAFSDGLSTSMVEAMANGAFPIQSLNSAASVFIENGVTGFAVDPWNLEDIARCIDMALSDNELVDRASISNIKTLERNYNYNEGISLMKKIYST